MIIMIMLKFFVYTTANGISEVRFLKMWLQAETWLAALF